MANGWGGRRPGSGRKPKTDEELAAQNGRRRRRSVPEPARVLAHPSAPAAAPPLPVVDETDAPDELTMEERQVWLKLAPLAMANGTLTPASALAFVEVCKTVVVVRKLEAAPLQQGTANHSTWKKLLDAQLLNFNLRPCGKPMPDAAAPAEKPANPLDRFLKRSHGA